MRYQFVTLFVSAAIVIGFARDSAAQAVNQSAPTSKNYVSQGKYVQRTDKAAILRKELGVNSIGLTTSYKRAFSAVASGPAKKPFSSASHRPTVSPYLNLLREDLGDGAPNYHAFVKPQLNQIRLNQRQQQQNQMVYRQLQALQGRAAFPTQGSENLFPTGHQTVYMNYLHYYRFPRVQR